MFFVLLITHEHSRLTGAPTNTTFDWKPSRYEKLLPERNFMKFRLFFFSAVVILGDGFYFQQVLALRKLAYINHCNCAALAGFGVCDCQQRLRDKLSIDLNGKIVRQTIQPVSLVGCLASQTFRALLFFGGGVE